jgi:hypothetical protein
MKVHPDIVAIGASSGGIEALQSLLEGLSDLDAVVLRVGRLNRDSPSRSRPGFDKCQKSLTPKVFPLQLP